ELWVENSVLHYQVAEGGERIDSSIRISHELFLDIVLGISSLADMVGSDQLEVSGSAIKLVQFFSLLDKSSEPFAIIEP
ncbi:MAG: MBL fold metallo-hydrolase, partial [Cellvibrionaceae bacterium]|nr:MBL fold metallo-hydrolase [Cellvibrionaceae bacterium]